MVSGMKLVTANYDWLLRMLLIFLSVGKLGGFMVFILDLGVVDTPVAHVFVTTSSSGAPIWIVIPI